MNGRKDWQIVHNKERGYPNQDGNKLDGLPRAQAKYASKRADGTIQTRPAERMLKSNKRDDLEEYHRLVTPKKKIQQATVCWIFLSMLPLNK